MGRKQKYLIELRARPDDAEGVHRVAVNCDNFIQNRNLNAPYGQQKPALAIFNCARNRVII